MLKRELLLVVAALSLHNLPASAQDAQMPDSPPTPKSVAPPVERTGEVQIKVNSASNEKPLGGATVTLVSALDANIHLTLAANPQGMVDFKNLFPGDYLVSIVETNHEGEKTRLHVDAGICTTYVSYLDIPGGERILKVVERHILVDTTSAAGSTQVQRSNTFIDTGIANSRSMQAVLNTAAGVQSDANGQVHVRGEHKSLSYEFDGLEVPNGLSNNYASLFDPRFVDDLSIKLGNYDAAQFGQLGAVLTLNNEAGKIDPYVKLETGVGDHHFLEGVIKAEGSNKEGTFDYLVGAHIEGTELRTEPPLPNHQDFNNNGQDTNIELRLRAKPGDNDKLGFIFVHQTDTLGVPDDQKSYQANVRQSLSDRNDLALLSWDHQLTDQDLFKLGLIYFSSAERYTNNGAYTTFTPISAAISPSLAAAGEPADPTNAGSPYLPTSNLNVNQFQQQIEYSHEFNDKDSIRFGANADFISSAQTVNIVDAGGGGALPNITGSSTPPTMFATSNQRRGFFGGVFFSQNVSLTDNVSLNYGVRAELFNNGAGDQTGQISPRINFLWAPDDHSALRVSYNSLFQPPPLEIDVSGLTSAIPQKTDQYEISYQFQPARDLIVTAGYVYKSFKNQLDVGLLIPNSSVPIFAPLNFNRAYYDGVELTVSSKRAEGLNGFFTATYGVAKPTQGSVFEGSDLPAYNDHDQRAQITGGLSESWSHGWFAESDFLFGTGYPQDTLAGYNAVGIYPFGLDPNGGRLSHFYVNASIGFTPTNKDGKEKNGLGFKLQILNLFDNRSDLNFLSGFSGTRFSTGRQVILNTSLRF